MTFLPARGGGGNCKETPPRIRICIALYYISVAIRCHLGSDPKEAEKTNGKSEHQNKNNASQFLLFHEETENQRSHSCE
ncbi:hypothetical protein JTE90_024265 [Oedothorax gibbosus]|uniref:Uncharacterized protein n=1 Tax=Oedothorax gibbosus TaxID=931172 RepID=A0AAV6VQ41_9ARAC|nr:hypothetical protein JTE90_024265 [Oedothorax gibbosus]